MMTWRANAAARPEAVAQHMSQFWSKPMVESFRAQCGNNEQNEGGVHFGPRIMGAQGKKGAKSIYVWCWVSARPIVVVPDVP